MNNNFSPKKKNINKRNNQSPEKEIAMSQEVMNILSDSPLAKQNQFKEYVKNLEQFCQPFLSLQRNIIESFMQNSTDNNNKDSNNLKLSSYISSENYENFQKQIERNCYGLINIVIQKVFNLDVQQHEIYQQFQQAQKNKTAVYMINLQKYFQSQDQQYKHDLSYLIQGLRLSDNSLRKNLNTYLMADSESEGFQTEDDENQMKKGDFYKSGGQDNILKFNGKEEKMQFLENQEKLLQQTKSQKEEIEQLKIQLEKSKQSIESRNQTIQGLTSGYLKDIQHMKEMIFKKNQNIDEMDFYEVQYFQISQVLDDNTLKLLNGKLEDLKNQFNEKTQSFVKKLLAQDSEIEKLRKDLQISNSVNPHLLVKKLLKNENNPYNLYKVFQDMDVTEALKKVYLTQKSGYGIDYDKINHLFMSKRFYEKDYTSYKMEIDNQLNGIVQSTIDQVNELVGDCEEKDKEIKNLKDIRNAFLEEKKQEFISAAIDYVNEKEEMLLDIVQKEKNELQAEYGQIEQLQLRQMFSKWALVNKVHKLSNFKDSVEMKRSLKSLLFDEGTKNLIKRYYEQTIQQQKEQLKVMQEKIIKLKGQYQSLNQDMEKVTESYHNTDFKYSQVQKQNDELKFELGVKNRRLKVYRNSLQQVFKQLSIKIDENSFDTLDLEDEKQTSTSQFFQKLQKFETKEQRILRETKIIGEKVQGSADIIDAQFTFNFKDAEVMTDYFDINVKLSQFEHSDSDQESVLNQSSNKIKQSIQQEILCDSDNEELNQEEKNKKETNKDLIKALATSILTSNQSQEDIELTLLKQQREIEKNAFEEKKKIKQKVLELEQQIENQQKQIYKLEKENSDQKTQQKQQLQEQQSKQLSELEKSNLIASLRASTLENDKKQKNIKQNEINNLEFENLKDENSKKLKEIYNQQLELMNEEEQSEEFKKSLAVQIECKNRNIEKLIKFQENSNKFIDNLETQQEQLQKQIEDLFQIQKEQKQQIYNQEKSIEQKNDMVKKLENQIQDYQKQKIDQLNDQKIQQIYAQQNEQIKIYEQKLSHLNEENKVQLKNMEEQKTQIEIYKEEINSLQKLKQDQKELQIVNAQLQQQVTQYKKQIGLQQERENKSSNKNYKSIIQKEVQVQTDPVNQSELLNSFKQENIQHPQFLDQNYSQHSSQDKNNKVNQNDAQTIDILNQKKSQNANVNINTQISEFQDKNLIKNSENIQNESSISKINSSQQNTYQTDQKLKVEKTENDNNNNQISYERNDTDLQSYQLQQKYQNYDTGNSMTLSRKQQGKNQHVNQNQPHILTKKYSEYIGQLQQKSKDYTQNGYNNQINSAEKQYISNNQNLKSENLVNQDLNQDQQDKINKLKLNIEKIEKQYWDELLKLLQNQLISQKVNNSTNSYIFMETSLPSVNKTQGIGFQEENLKTGITFPSINLTQYQTLGNNFNHTNNRNNKDNKIGNKSLLLNQIQLQKQQLKNQQNGNEIQNQLEKNSFSRDSSPQFQSKTQNLKQQMQQKQGQQLYYDDIQQLQMKTLYNQQHQFKDQKQIAQIFKEINKQIYKKRIMYFENLIQQIALENQKNQSKLDFNNFKNQSKVEQLSPTFQSKNNQQEGNFFNKDLAEDEIIQKRFKQNKSVKQHQKDQTVLEHVNKVQNIDEFKTLKIPQKNNNSTFKKQERRSRAQNYSVQSKEIQEKNTYNMIQQTLDNGSMNLLDHVNSKNKPDDFGQRNNGKLKRIVRGKSNQIAGNVFLPDSVVKLIQDAKNNSSLAEYKHYVENQNQFNNYKNK